MRQRKRFHLSRENYIGARIYFVTLCSARHAAIFSEATLAAETISILKDEAGQAGFLLHAWCLMPDHLHVLAEGAREDAELFRFLTRFKRRTAASHHHHRDGINLWQRNFYEHIVRSHEKLGRVANYIWMNPVRKGLCESVNEYPHSGSLTMPWREAARDAWTPPWKKDRM